MKSILPKLIGPAVVLVIIAVWLWIDPLAFNRVYRVVEVTWLPVAAFLLLAGLGLVAMISRDKVGRHRMETWPLTLGIVAGVLAVIGVSTLRWWNVETEFADLAEVSDDQPSFEERVPHSVADRSARSALEGGGASLNDTVYLTGANAYSTTADANSVLGFGGYSAVVEQHFDLDGSFSENNQCGFSENANRRIGGDLGNSLERAIASENRFAIFDGEDAWGYCDEDTAMVALPFDVRAGNPLNRHFVPGGVAIYDGGTGEVEILEEVAADELPGPVITESYASRVAGAMNLRDRDGIMSVILSHTGYTTPDDASINHQLSVEPEGSAHVTALRNVSGSTAIEYILAVPSGEVTAGEHPEVVMHRLDPTRRENPIIIDSIRSQFADINWESGIGILEITPGPDGTWVASIGQATDVVYRVSMDGNESSTWTIRDMRTGTEQEVDEADVADPDTDAEGDDASSEPITGSEDVSELTDEQLINLVREVLNEMESRETADQE